MYENTSMVNKFLHKKIAQQAGFSLATVDRALHRRANVSTQTIQRVKLALEELVEQEDQLAVRSQRIFVDIVIEAPKRFSNEVPSAVQYIFNYSFSDRIAIIVPALAMSAMPKN